eukprot:XP_014060233.1 PREDICTED: trace amine-associated receptor 1-like [Salmo salar]
MDIVRPLVKTARGHRYILVMVDYASRYPEAIPLRAAVSKGIAQELFHLFSRVGIPNEILTDQAESCWYFGDLLCKIYTSTDIMLSNISILNLCFISFDRYYAVCRPLLYRTKITVHFVLIMMLVIWTGSAIVVFGIVFLELSTWGVEDFYYKNVACEGQCILFQNKASSTVSLVLSFYIPGVGMLSIYLKIFQIAQRQARSIQLTTNQNSVGKSQRKATKTLAIIMGVFLSFWTPFFVINCIDPFISYSTPPVLFETLIWIGYLNSTINPMVYAFFYSWFRRAFRIIISGQIFQPDSSEIQLFSE